MFSMANSWRTLITVIVTEVSHHGDPRPAVDILDLQYFAKYTPYIREIKLPFSSYLRGQWDIPSAMPKPMRQVTPITLHHGWTISRNVVLAASFLYITFGSVNLVRIGYGRGDDLEGALEGVLRNRHSDGTIMWDRLLHGQWEM